MSAVPLESDADPYPRKVTDQKDSPRRRVDSIDLLRGIVMVIMLLDHTRDFVHYLQLQGFDPTDLAHSSFKIFFTRWITHYCAPTFVFLAGVGAYLQIAAGKNKKNLSWFLLTRGFWLVVLEFTVVRFVAFMNFDYRFIGVAQVIWVIGVSMIVLAALIHLPIRFIAAFSVLMIALHNLLDRFHVQGWNGPNTPVPSFGSKLFMFSHVPFQGFPIFGWPSPVVFIIYPLIPWIGVMAAGYCLGAIYQLDIERRRRILFRLGIATTVLFFVLRAINRYGDPAPWSTQKNWVFTLMSFFNVTKYPPSLLFVLMTLGPAIILLGLFEGRWLMDQTGIVKKIKEIFVTFGRVPLFFYILQWVMAHLTSIVAHLIAGKAIGWMFASPVDFKPPPPGSGFNLAIVYVCWITGVILLYPLCKWFAAVKKRRRSWWLSYL